MAEPSIADQGYGSHRNMQLRQSQPSISPQSLHNNTTYIPRNLHPAQLGQHDGHQQQQQQQQSPFQQTSFTSQLGHQQQQRPPIAPTHQLRLHHSISAGNIALIANAGRFGGSTAGSGRAFGSSSSATASTSGGIATPKKKDPYATAWRTYSKIAEELQLLNSDGSLYPISKEAILKYLHHQSKRIKSSNLHWYVNGLKKHQENLGFPWDDVRYDDQVVGLLKELTLHPVMVENGDEDHHHHHHHHSHNHPHRLHTHHQHQHGNHSGHGHPFGSQPNRHGQSSSSSNSHNSLGWKGGHNYSSSSSSAVDTTRIANLSISQPTSPPQHAQQQSHPRNPQQHIHSGATSFSGTPKQYVSNNNQRYPQSQTIQQPPPTTPFYFSAPIKLSSISALPATSSSSSMSSHHTRAPSGQDILGRHSEQLSPSSSRHHQQQHSHHQSLQRGGASGTGTGTDRDVHAALPPPCSGDMHCGRNDRDAPTTGNVNTAGTALYVKRKRNESGHQKRRVPSLNFERDDQEEDDHLREHDLQDGDNNLDDDLAAGASNHDMEDFDDLEEREDSRRCQPLKRRASTGTLLNLAKAKHISLKFEFYNHENGGATPQPYDDQHHQCRRYVDSPSLDLGAIGRDDIHYSSLLRQDTALSASSSAEMDSSSPFAIRPRASALGTEGLGDGVHSTPIAGSTTNYLLARQPVSTSAITTATTDTTANTTATTTATGLVKMTVQFSEVVECAQQLQLKYGNRCKDHPWGCVKIVQGDRHLELTIKMYLDWAGLVASGRLTMEDLPDLPEFRTSADRQGVLGFESTDSNSTIGTSALGGRDRDGTVTLLDGAGGLGGGGTLKRMSSTPFSSLHSSKFNRLGPDTFCQSPLASLIPAKQTTEEDPQSLRSRRTKSTIGFPSCTLGDTAHHGKEEDEKGANVLMLRMGKATTLTFATPPQVTRRSLGAAAAVASTSGHGGEHESRHVQSFQLNPALPAVAADPGSSADEDGGDLDRNLQRHARLHSTVMSISTASSPATELDSDEDDDVVDESDREKDRAVKDGNGHHSNCQGGSNGYNEDTLAMDVDTLEQDVDEAVAQVHGSGSRKCVETMGTLTGGLGTWSAFTSSSTSVTTMTTNSVSWANMRKEATTMREGMEDDEEERCRATPNRIAEKAAQAETDRGNESHEGGGGGGGEDGPLQQQEQQPQPQSQHLLQLQELSQLVEGTLEDDNGRSSGIAVEIMHSKDGDEQGRQESGDRRFGEISEVALGYSSHPQPIQQHQQQPLRTASSNGSGRGREGSVEVRKESKLKMMMGRGKALFAGSSATVTSTLSLTSASKPPETGTAVATATSTVTAALSTTTKSLTSSPTIGLAFGPATTILATTTEGPTGVGTGPGSALVEDHENINHNGGAAHTQVQSDDVDMID
ncbi:hypothetical protein BG004_003312 [Podila humilis]|nr:hypothetical protein BG004_003312 [Podila humilis]